ncbi:MAG: hypothetical protein KJ955_05670 [Nanoarchaeota archaeon]|nr:hypothetical protein [Nanoarchaeota archaeon]
MAAGCGLALAGSIGVAVTHGKAEENYSSQVERICIIERALEHRNAVERPWVQERYALLEDELNDLKDIPSIIQEKKAYESARNSEAWFLLMMGIGYTACIAGRLRE